MVNAESLVNSTELWRSMEPIILERLSPLVTIFKAVGIAILAYVIFLIVKALFRWRTVNKVGKIAEDVREINHKLDLIVKKYHVKSAEKINKKEKKKKKK